MGKPHAHRHADEGLMSLTACLAPANTMAYPNGGGHLWVYLNWVLGLRALGCQVIWLEVVDRSVAPGVTREGGGATEPARGLRPGAVAGARAEGRGIPGPRRRRRSGPRPGPRILR